MRRGSFYLLFLHALIRREPLFRADWNRPQRPAQSPQSAAPTPSTAEAACKLPALGLPRGGAYWSSQTGAHELKSPLST